MGTVLCKFLHSLQIGSLAASVFSLVVISLDRSFAILFPMKKIMTRNVVRFTIAMTWLDALALMLPVMIATKNKQWEGGDGMICDEFWKPMSTKVYVTVVFVTSYIVPLIIIALVYCLAGLRLYRRKLSGHQNQTAHNKIQVSSRRATAMLITVTVILALSWLPLQALERIKVYKPSISHFPWFGYCNSAINLVLYGIYSREIIAASFIGFYAEGQAGKTARGRLF
ncbi:neuropeptide FF receptor 2-like [Orbicella faveolata]|uniref:neuropeptide FF receptor 2-like n=1 Tax=Orbicella faveolata TaxID=48498 RepID=UPI0009E51CCF|nr:neuropeptide FF receptor 2-like [Orbicella faveolata]